MRDASSFLQAVNALQCLWCWHLHGRNGACERAFCASAASQQVGQLYQHQGLTQSVDETHRPSKSLVQMSPLATPATQHSTRLSNPACGLQTRCRLSQCVSANAHHGSQGVQCCDLLHYKRCGVPADVRAIADAAKDSWRASLPVLRGLGGCADGD